MVEGAQSIVTLCAFSVASGSFVGPLMKLITSDPPDLLSVGRDVGVVGTKSLAE